MNSATRIHLSRWVQCYRIGVRIASLAAGSGFRVTGLAPGLRAELGNADSLLEQGGALLRYRLGVMGLAVESGADLSYTDPFLQQAGTL